MGEEFPKDISVADAHMILSLLWVSSMKADFAIAEANIVLKHASTSDYKYIGNSTLSLAMYENKWNSLAQEYSAISQSLIKDPLLKEQFKQKQIVFYLLAGVLSVKNGQYDTAQASFTALGETMQYPLISDITKPLLQIRQGNFQVGMKNLKALSNNPELNDEGRSFVKGIVANVEAKYGNVESNAFVFNVLIDAVMHKVATDNPDVAMSKLFFKIQSYSEKVSF